MTIARLEMKTIALSLLTLVVGLAACGGGPGPNTPAARPASVVGASIPAGVASPVASASAGSAADTQLCQQACTTLTACGVEYGADCVSNCLKAPTFVACARTAPQTCNGLALCAFHEDSAETCGNETAGVPAGGDTCGSAALCEGVCAASSQPASCRCACNARMAPDRAINLLINNQCALAKCASTCGAGGNGPACVACFQQSCQAEGAQCAAADAGASAPTTSTETTTTNDSLPAIPTTATNVPAAAGTLDPTLVDTYTLTSVQMMWDGSQGTDISLSQAIVAKLGAGAALVLNADGTFSFNGTTGNWAVTGFQPADKAIWGTGGRGPAGYPREIVLSQGGQLYGQGPIEDASPPGTAAWGVNLAFHVDGARPGTAMLMFHRLTTATNPGVKR